MLRIPARGRYVTAEPLTVAPQLLDAPLASFRRRAAAYLLDLALFGIVVGAVFLALSALSVHRGDPTFFPRLYAYATGRADEGAGRRLGLDFLHLVVDRAPDALPPELAEAVVAGDWERVDAQMDTDRLSVAFTTRETTLERSGEA
jgi:hypothetical protein